jgi:flagellar protein FlgJ
MVVSMDISKINAGGIDGNTAQSFADRAAGAAVSAEDESFAKKLEAAMASNNDRELKKACQEFESIMLSILYKQMKATVIKSDLIEKDPGTEIFESMRDEALMEQASRTGSLGLAESLYRQLSRNTGAGIKNVDKEAVQDSGAVPEGTGE